MLTYRDLYIITGSTGERYEVRHKDGEWSCTCPHWGFRLRKLGQACKHITQAKVHDLLMEHYEREIVEKFDGIDFTTPYPWEKPKEVFDDEA